jgi:hypothetical protein
MGQTTVIPISLYDVMVQPARQGQHHTIQTLPKLAMVPSSIGSQKLQVSIFWVSRTVELCQGYDDPGTTIAVQVQWLERHRWL